MYAILNTEFMHNTEARLYGILHIVNNCTASIPCYAIHKLNKLIFQQTPNTYRTNKQSHTRTHAHTIWDWWQFHSLGHLWHLSSDVQRLTHLLCIIHRVHKIWTLSPLSIGHRFLPPFCLNIWWKFEAYSSWYSIWKA